MGQVVAPENVLRCSTTNPVPSAGNRTSRTRHREERLPSRSRSSSSLQIGTRKGRSLAVRVVEEGHLIKQTTGRTLLDGWRKYLWRQRTLRQLAPTRAPTSAARKSRSSLTTYPRAAQRPRRKEEAGANNS